MRFYSRLQINILSIIVSLIIYIFLIEYIPKIYKVGKAYFYYKSQPDIVKEYED